MPYKILGQSLGKTAVFSDNSGQVLYLDSFGSEVLELYNSSIDPLTSVAHPPDELPRPSALAGVWDSLWEADQRLPLETQTNPLNHDASVSAWPDPSGETGLIRVSLCVGRKPIRLHIAPVYSDQLLRDLSRCFDITDGHPEPAAADIVIDGNPDGIIKSVWGHKLISRMTYESLDALVVDLFNEITELSIDYQNAIGALHAALVTRNGVELVLCNPSGSGKTTLAWLLHQAGWTLFHDDVLPVFPDKSCEQVRSPSTIKEGSWAVLETAKVPLEEQHFLRFGKRIKYLSLPQTSAPRTLSNTRFLFVQYDSEVNALESVDSLDAFQRVFASEVVMKNVCFQNVKQIFDLVAGSRVAELRYHDFSLAAKLIDDWI